MEMVGVKMLERKLARDWGTEEARLLTESIMTTASGRC